MPIKLNGSETALHQNVSDRKPFSTSLVPETYFDACSANVRDIYLSIQPQIHIYYISPLLDFSPGCVFAFERVIHFSSFYHLLMRLYSKLYSLAERENYNVNQLVYIPVGHIQYSPGFLASMRTITILLQFNSIVRNSNFKMDNLVSSKIKYKLYWSTRFIDRLF